MSDQANALRDLMERRQSTPHFAAADSPTPRRVQTIAVTSGKGGVGKSSIALNLAIGLARLDSQVCLLDANLGLGNIDLMCGLNGYWNLSHVMTGARRIEDVILDGPEGIHVVPGASGLGETDSCPQAVLNEILLQLEELEYAHDCLVIDTGTGIHAAVRPFVESADLVLLVTTPEPTSIADAYATIKSLSTRISGQLKVLVNQAASAQQAEQVFERIRQTTRLFLRNDVESAGYIPRDFNVADAVVRRTPLLQYNDESPAADALLKLAHRLKGRFASADESTSYFSRLWRPAAALR